MLCTSLFLDSLSLSPYAAGNDYVALTDFPLYYGAGSPLNSERCVNIIIINDDVIEPDQSFAVSLSTDDPVFLTPIDQAVVTIETDNDSKRNSNVKVCIALIRGISSFFFKEGIINNCIALIN